MQHTTGTHDHREGDMLLTARDGPIVTLTLNRPHVHNAFNPALIQALTDAYTTLAHDDTIRAVILAAHGPSYSAGADLHWMADSLTYTPDQNRDDAHRLAAMLDAIAQCPHPTIARVHGAARGGGVGLIAACNLAIAADTVTLALSEARLGLAPAVIAPHLLTHISPGALGAHALTAEPIDAAQAHRIGLLHRIVPPDQLDIAISHTVEHLRKAGPAAIRAIKTLIHTLPTLTPPDARAYTAALIADLRTTPEGQEGIRAYLEKRPPSWRDS